MPDVIKEFWATWGPWIALSLIPTIIAGLSNSPRTQGAATFLEGLWAKTKTALGFLSVATFKDVPGTFKAPLTPSRTTPKLPSNIVESGMAFLVAVTLLGSCGPIHDVTDKTKTVVFDCTTQAVAANAAHLLPIIISIITSDAPNWKQMIAAFTKELGADAVACALQMAAIELQARVPATGPEGSPEATLNLTGMQRARIVISEQKWQFKE